MTASVLDLRAAVIGWEVDIPFKISGCHYSVMSESLHNYHFLLRTESRHMISLFGQFSWHFGKTLTENRCSVNTMSKADRFNTVMMPLCQVATSNKKLHWTSEPCSFWKMKLGGNSNILFSKLSFCSQEEALCVLNMFHQQWH